MKIEYKTKVIERDYDHIKVMSMGKLYILRFKDCKRSRDEILNKCDENYQKKAIPFGQISLFG